ncbi:MAG: U32 family peptidase [Eubacteriaceae bacterium]|nr:U32 family peptidase [Eubacteriaceae bacterium]
MSVELLSPAGDMESFEAAVSYGADAVYAGGPMMQMRSDKVGFSTRDISILASKAHEAGKKLYVTVNSLAKNSEIDMLGGYVSALNDAGADALIVSDIGVLTVIKSVCPDMPVHISTQASCMNYASAMAYYNMGAERVILAREASIDDIAEIRAKTPRALQLEAFVHGSMCMAYSGRCLISSFMTGRSGNRGECAQPCRWNYYLYEEKTPGEYFEITESEGGSMILSSRDLNCIGILDRLIEAGIESFKIEGRMKSAYYVAAVTNAYRMAMDDRSMVPVAKEELELINHRPYCTGFYLPEGEKEVCLGGPASSGAEFVGRVISSSDGILTVQQRNLFRQGEVLEILSPGDVGRSFTAERMTDQDGAEITAAPHPRQIVNIYSSCEAKPGDFLRRRNS